MTFELELQALETRVDLPYPERALVIDELAGELEAVFLAHLGRGVDPERAKALAWAELELDSGAVAALEALHTPAVRRALARLPRAVSASFDFTVATVTLIAVMLYILSEVPVVMFLREAGVAMWLVLGFGGLALLLELQRAVAWLLMRDHSAASLGRDTPTPLFLAAASFLVGVQGAAIGYYVIFSQWAQGRLQGESFAAALKEPLPNLIVASGLAAVVVLTDAVVKSALRAFRIPPRSSQSKKGPVQ